MKKLVLLLLVALCLAPSLLAQPVSVPLHNPQAAVVSTYAQLSAQRLADRRSLYATLPAQMQEDLWALHLSYFLADHPELTSEEKALVFEGLGLVESGIMEVDPASAEWRTNTLASAHSFEGRVRKIGTKVLLEAFTRLGGPEITYPSAGAKGLRSDWQPGGDCECNTTHDFCCLGPECSTTTTPNCRRPVRPWCIAGHGCGILLLEDCDGVCGP